MICLHKPVNLDKNPDENFRPYRNTLRIPFFFCGTLAYQRIDLTFLMAFQNVMLLRSDLNFFYPSITSLCQYRLKSIQTEANTQLGPGFQVVGPAKDSKSAKKVKFTAVVKSSFWVCKGCRYIYYLDFRRSLKVLGEQVPQTSKHFWQTTALLQLALFTL